MQTHNTTVDVLTRNGSSQTAEVEWWHDYDSDAPDRPSSFLKLTVEGRSAKTVAYDFFEAFQKVRKPFECEGYRFICYGASLNVWPTGMARDMGGGLKAYRLYQGHPASLDDLVPIFETGEDVTPSSVDEQIAFLDTWCGSW